MISPINERHSALRQTLEWLNGAELREIPRRGKSLSIKDLWVAEQEGFEPSIRGYRIHTFQACAFDHSATAPLILSALPHRCMGAWVPIAKSGLKWREARQAKQECAPLAGLGIPCNCDNREAGPRRKFYAQAGTRSGAAAFRIYTPQVAVLRGMAFPANTVTEPLPAHKNAREGAFLLRRRWHAAAP